MTEFRHNKIVQSPPEIVFNQALKRTGFIETLRYNTTITTFLSLVGHISSHYSTMSDLNSDLEGRQKEGKIDPVI